MGPKLRLTHSFLFSDYMDTACYTIGHQDGYIQVPFLIFNVGKIFSRFPPSQHQFRGNNAEALKSCIQFVSYKNYSEKSDNSISCLHGSLNVSPLSSLTLEVQVHLGSEPLKSAHPCLMWWCNLHVPEPFVGRCGDNGPKRERWVALGGKIYLIHAFILGRHCCLN